MGCKKSYKSLHKQDRPSLLELPRVSAPVDTRNKIPIKRISPTQMEDRKKKDLCYNCDDKRALGHRCKNATLFLLEGIEMVQDSSCEVQLIEIEDGVTIARVQEEEIDVEITLYALVGSPIPGTMRVKRRIKTVSLVILVNSGISHNFIDAALIPDLQIPVDVSQILEVKVANGEIIKTQRLCKDVPMFIHGQIFLVHLHVLPWGAVTWFWGLSGLVP